ncbi:MAG: EAL domain-containing protein [Actinomycetota bacterium]|nr:EAL domain-containing protein [Actinomycetota bacterium]
MPRALWLVHLVAGLLAGSLYFLLPPTGPPARILYVGFNIAAVVAIVYGTLSNRPAQPRGWYALAGGQAFYALANAIWLQTPPFPSPADALYFISYALLFLGLALLIHDLKAGRDRTGTIDSLIVAISMGVLAWIFLIHPYVGLSELPLLSKLVSIAYPLTDILLLAVLARLFFIPGTRLPSFWILVGGVLAQLVADIVYTLNLLRGQFQYGQWYVAGWLLLALLMGAAALHPSMGSFIKQKPGEVESTPSPWRLAALGLVPLMASSVLIVQEVLDRNFKHLVITIIVMALFALVIIRLIGLVSDIKRRKALETELSHLAFHDHLTGLPNRALFRDRLETALRRATRRGEPLAVVMIDMDGFKGINDSMGHHVGDSVLVEIAHRIEASLRASDTCGRLGGDEFGLLLEESDAAIALKAVERLYEELLPPFIFEDTEFFLQASSGISVAAGGEDEDALLRNADSAMYAAKERGDGNCQVFEPQVHNRAIQELTLRSELRRAIANDEFLLEYQAIADLTTGRTVGAEALVRWIHPTKGSIPSKHFIEIAEQTGLIVPLGGWVLENACREAAMWNLLSEGRPAFHLAVSLSARQLGDPELAERIGEILSATGLAAKNLVLEITETSLAGDLEPAIDDMRRLKELGVRLAIDDFGAGYSSLPNLKRLPVDMVKIDRGLVGETASTPEEWSLTHAIVKLIRALGLETVAEGIEDVAALAHVRDLGCDLAQGSYIAEPMPAETLRELLMTQDASEPLAAS